MRLIWYNRDEFSDQDMIRANDEISEQAGARHRAPVRRGQ